MPNDKLSGLVMGASHTWRLLCSSVLAMTSCLITDYDLLPNTELHRSLEGVIITLRLKMAQKPYITWSFGSNNLKHESFVCGAISSSQSRNVL